MKKNTEPLRGEKLLKTAINQILKHPETWYQGSWHSACGTKHCIAGWCQILSGHAQNELTTKEDAQKALEITSYEAANLFRPDCSLAEMYYFAENFNRAGFNRAGFNRAGYDRAGYDRAGYDRAGYDRAGYDRAGYDRAGFNRAGFNRAGFNRAGKQLTPFDI
jgi:hypothetical protein